MTETDASGDRRVSRRRAGEDERREQDEDVNRLLRERGIPERPGGFRWFPLVPPGGSGRDRPHPGGCLIRVQSSSLS